MTEEASYFTAQQTASRGAAGTWLDLPTDMPPFQVLEGLTFQPVLGQQLAINIVRFEPNTLAPLHSHEEEQISLVLEGELEFEVSGETRVVGPNMAVVIPPNAPHSARTRDTTCLAVDAFHPPRKGLAEMAQEALRQR